MEFEPLIDLIEHEKPLNIWMHPVLFIGFVAMYPLNVDRFTSAPFLMNNVNGAIYKDDISHQAEISYVDLPDNKIFFNLEPNPFDVYEYDFELNVRSYPEDINSIIKTHFFDYSYECSVCKQNFKVIVLHQMTCDECIVQDIII